ncbi:YchJ family protein [Kitasatospora sp. NPDC052896]|uniref:YchJ family protein n=1 Tax=Kitasatospora sp. NPDC052896 TaxID=3364061 RepID=UPI0037C94BDD
MSRRRTQRPKPQPTPRPEQLSPAAPCPCGLPASYADCCGRFHRGGLAAPTAELLMRSRYSAFALRDEAYLLRSWDPVTRPERIDFDPRITWTGLEVLGHTDGGPFHTEGTVTFRAHYREQGDPGLMTERSHFVRHEGAWVYHAELSD